MRTEAATASSYVSPWDEERDPRLQIVTVAEVLDGRGVAYPAKKAGSNVTFASAKKNVPGPPVSAELFPKAG